MTEDTTPDMGLQLIKDTEGNNVMVKHVDGLSLDMFEIDGEEVYAMSLYSVPAAVGFVRPMGEKCMRDLAAALTTAADYAARKPS